MSGTVRSSGTAMPALDCKTSAHVLGLEPYQTFMSWLGFFENNIREGVCAGEKCAGAEQNPTSIMCLSR